MCPIWVRLIPVTFPQVKQPTGYNQKDNVKRNYLTFWLKLKIEKLILIGSKLRVTCQNGFLVLFFRSLTISVFMPVRTFPTWNLLRQEEEKSALTRESTYARHRPSVRNSRWGAIVWEKQRLWENEKIKRETRFDKSPVIYYRWIWVLQFSTSPKW